MGLYAEAIQEDLFIPSNPRLMVQAICKATLNFRPRSLKWLFYLAGTRLAQQRDSMFPCRCYEEILGNHIIRQRADPKGIGHIFAIIFYSVGCDG